MFDAYTAENSTVETAAAVKSGRPVEMSMFDNPDRAASLFVQELAGAGAAVQTSQRLGIEWLPAAAEKLGTSPHMRDYIAVPVVLLPSDLPNRNLVAFPRSRIVEFDTSTGRLAYQSWLGMPMHKDHVNSDPTIAKGVVLDVAVRRIKNAHGNLCKVIALCGIDRRRDPLLANKILTGEVSDYSMGAMVRGYHCSICGVESAKPAAPKCSHIPARRNQFNTFPKNGKRHLAYWNTGPFKGFEVSALERALPPAFDSARVTKLDNIVLG
jgi:hypothetical protein